MTPCVMVEIYRIFTGPSSFYHLIDLDDGSGKCIRIIHAFLLQCVSYSGRQNLHSNHSWKFHISNHICLVVFTMVCCTPCLYEHRMKQNEVQKPLTENGLRPKIHAVISRSLSTDYFLRVLFITLYAVINLMICFYR
jgi:hypothetical protein